MNWRKSRRSTSNGGNCVEVASVPGGRRVAARDSKQPAGPVLEYERSEWRRFIAQVKRGSFDR
jgi:hypothetical protein